MLLYPGIPVADGIRSTLYELDGDGASVFRNPLPDLAESTFSKDMEAEIMLVANGVEKI